MKQVININFQGRVIPIEVTAFELVKQYTDSLKLHFASEVGKEEIINDIEGRIGELFHERIKSGAACITELDVEAVISSIGRPEQFDREESDSAETKSEESSGPSTSGPKKLFRNEARKMLGGVCAGVADYFNVDVVIVRVLFIIFFGPLFLPYIILWIALPGTSEKTLGSQTKKLFRDPDDKIIAGVCGGLSKYFGINAWIPRIIFLIPLIAFVFDGDDSFFFPGLIKITMSPGAILIYLLFWLLIPRARTATEKLQMRGEKVDISNLQNRMMQEAKEISKITGERVNEIKNDLSQKAKNGNSALGRLIMGFFKAILYMVMGLAAFIAFIIIISLGISAIVLFPLKDFIIGAGWQDMLAWGTLVFLVFVPLFAILIWIIRRIIRAKSHSRSLRISFLILWLLGLACGVMLLFSAATEFRYQSKSERSEINLMNPRANTLQINAAPGSIMLIDSEKDFEISFSDLIHLDSIPFNHVKVKMHRSQTDSFRVFVTSSSYGRSRMDAAKNMARINPIVESADSALLVKPGININRKNKFRMQEVVLDVYVPEGKKLIIDEGFEQENVLFDHKEKSWQNSSVSTEI